jgi:hypothetical protein
VVGVAPSRLIYRRLSAAYPKRRQKKTHRQHRWNGSGGFYESQISMTQLVQRDYQGHMIALQSDGWFNATQAAAAWDRRVDVWLKSKETQDYIAALCEITNTTEKGYLKAKRGASGGTWLHPKLAVRFAQWLDPKFAIWCDAQIDNLVRGKDDWTKLRHAAASSTKVQAAMLQQVREAIGKATEAHHYMNEHRLVNSLLSGEYKGIQRETLTGYQLDLLAYLELRNAVLIGTGMPYEQRKGALKAAALDFAAKHTQRIEVA